MSPDPLGGLDSAEAVKILPRHLAGPGPMDLKTAWPFPFDENWALHQLDEDTAYTHSPCLRLWTRFAAHPTSLDKGTWTIAANHRPFESAVWRISLDATTPIELLHDLHARLLDLYLEDRDSDHDRLFADTTAPHEAYTPLLARGWSHDIKTDGTQTFRSPDGHGTVRHWYAADGILGSAGPQWLAWSGPKPRPHWQARFSFSTPPTLVAAFTASLISTEPLQRTVQDIAFPTRQHLRVANPTTKQPPSYSPVAPPPAASAAGRPR
ncbi:DUF317 domain-containing protein [Streptomyces finlayi]|uniref:DUF317 domain-containing protein n=1 Tax=Streptomyces finlayi TaxID=67296 RepID=A0A7G7BGP8_9ACTN|nr:DUF317 domain-containing protein [Streptomyces finlayi]QNE74513.1 DUF317 domain-containing protein [Streptomyces finlayi]